MEGKTATAGECGASFSQASSSTTVKAMASGSSGTLAVRWRIPHAPWWCLVSTLLMAGAMVFNLAVIDPTRNLLDSGVIFVDLRVYWLAGRLLDAGLLLYRAGDPAALENISDVCTGL